jgi:hypothetical protein
VWLHFIAQLLSAAVTHSPHQALFSTVTSIASNSGRKKKKKTGGIQQQPPMEKCRSVPHEHSSSYYGGYDYEDVSGGGGSSGKSYSFNGPSARDDPEAKRRRRVASYNVLATQTRLKSTVRSSVKWLKSKFSDVRYGGL